MVQTDGDHPSDTEAPLALEEAASGDNSNSEAPQVANSGEDAMVCPIISPLDETASTLERRLKGVPEKPIFDPESHPAELQWTNIDLKEANKLPAVSASTFAETSSLSSFGALSVGMEDHFVTDEHPLWAWVSALSSSAQSLSLSITPAQTAVWRKQIFQQLSERTQRELENFRHYEQAVEQSVWVKTGTLQWWRNWKPYKWVDVRVALEQFTSNDGTRDSILFIYYMHYEEKKYIHVFLNEVTILVEILNEAKHSFALYTPEKTKQRWPIRLAAATEQEMHDWIQGPPSHQAIWSLTCKGDIFVSEPSPDLEAATHPMPCDQMFWRQIGGHLRLIESNSRGIVWGIGSYHGHKTMKDFVRRRRWARKCKIVTSGPWLEVPPIALWDVSIIPLSSAAKEEFVALWAISDKGDVLCRLCVTPENPAVWAVARDGSIFYRGSVSPKKPEGDCWYHIPSPPKQKLKQVSVGRTSVFVVDKNGNLWYRQGITPSYPQGTSWDHISNNVRKVSVGPLDQVWVIADKVQGSHSLSCGTVCHRTGVQPMEPKGLSWDYGIGGGWDHVTIRGNAVENTKIVSQETLAEHPNDSNELAAMGNDERGDGSLSTILVDASQDLDRNAVQC
ncbi:hypothetical protein JD844_019860 [Phrynosoma platyrhinos]|uniref:Tectonin beta-propeller repeat-containing protein 1 n=1 Tax=Phrynosoma platyrhinos TaxID=52577 RepID=A0ABQ7TQI9_PHRPL|nr:hypothetical protein JD844_019860 [Phrynosoma platyrhinos]